MAFHLMRRHQTSRNVPHDTTRDKGMLPSTRIVKVAARTMARAGKHRDLALPNDMTGTSIGDCIVEKSGEIRFNFKRREHTEEVASHNSSGLQRIRDRGRASLDRPVLLPSWRSLAAAATASRLLRGCVSETLSSSMAGASDLASGACPFPAVSSQLPAVCHEITAEASAGGRCTSGRAPGLESPNSGHTHVQLCPLSIPDGRVPSDLTEHCSFTFEPCDPSLVCEECGGVRSEKAFAWCCQLHRSNPPEIVFRELR